MAEDKTVPGMPTLAPGDAAGTVQIKAGASVGHAPPMMPTLAGNTAPGHAPPTMPTVAGGGAPDHAPPVMPTLAGDLAPTSAPPAMPPARYELGAEIARGGMGRVVEATDTVLGRVVALKEALGLDADALRRFQRETRITARLEHPSIVPVHDAGEMGGGMPYYVMRKISGRPLERLVATAETLNERLVLIPHVVAAAHAIAHAHERRVVHRDIKPSNILVGELGETIVIDWGLAKVIGEPDEPGLPGAASAAGAAGAPAIPDDPDDAVKTRAGIVFGTPGFMAPEQLRGAPVTERCDVYALGATLYHLLSRRPPHHAKTADEMMKAAAYTPATPIGELVPGVPPELSTIVEKALAHDADQRYPDARSLAEDLNRFLTGQLVASHRYSPRERVVRFVRKNRVPVMIALAAVVALVVGGTIAVARVIGERDRADAAARTAEDQRAKAEERLVKLTLGQARVLTDENPTLAVAMLKTIDRSYWRELRSIAAAARATGVAWTMPASKRVSTLEPSHDGLRVLAAGDDGVIRVYDLVKREARTIAELGTRVSARFADGERAIVVWHGNHLVVLDAATGAERSRLAAATRIVDLELVDATAYWTDDRGALWQLELGAAAPSQIATEERIVGLDPSPDRRWLALRGETHLLLHDRRQPAAPPYQLLFGFTRDLDWSSDGSRFAAIIAVHEDRTDGVIALVDPQPEVVQRREVGNHRFVAFANNRAYSFGPTGVFTIPNQDKVALIGTPVGLREARGGTVIAASHSVILALAGHGNRELKVPAGRLDIVDASPRSPYVVGAIDHQLLVWNLDEIQPRVLGEVPAFVRFAGAGRLLVGSVDDDDTPAQLVELDTGKTRELPAWALLDAVASRSGAAVCAIDLARRAHLIVDGRPPVDLPGSVDTAGFASEHELVLASRDSGTVQLHDLRTGELALQVARKAKLLEIAWSRSEPAWIAGSYADGVLWRKNLATGDEAALTITGPPRQLAMTPDGTVLFAEGRALRAWRPGADVDTHATLPKQIFAIGLTGSGPTGEPAAIAFTEADGVYVVELARRDVFSEADPVDELGAAMSIDSGLLAIAARFGIDIIDPSVRFRWTLAGSPGINYTLPQISSDGSRVLAQNGDALLLWTLVLPATPAATEQWLRAMTNATLDAQTSQVQWSAAPSR